MNLKSLRIFVNVMEEGTLARAAARLNLSQPAASRLLGLLEDEQGVFLFSRTRKRLEPTPEAEAFYPEALRILASIDEIPSFFDQVRKGDMPLRIICHPRIVNGLVLPAMARLSKRLPDLRMKLEIHPRRDLGRRIMHDLFDVGISTLPLPVESLTPRHLHTTKLHVLLPKGHRLAARASLKTKDLTGETYVALDSNTVIRQIVDAELTSKGVELPVGHEVSAGAAAYRLVKNGLGFTFADPIALDPELDNGVVLVPWKPDTEVRIGYFLSRASHRKDRVDALIECLESVCSARMKQFGMNPGKS